MKMTLNKKNNELITSSFMISYELYIQAHLRKVIYFFKYTTQKKNLVKWDDDFQILPSKTMIFKILSIRAYLES